MATKTAKPKAAPAKPAKAVRGPKGINVSKAVQKENERWVDRELKKANKAIAEKEAKQQTEAEAWAYQNFGLGSPPPATRDEVMTKKMAEILGEIDLLSADEETLPMGVYLQVPEGAKVRPDDPRGLLIAIKSVSDIFLLTEGGKGVSLLMQETLAAHAFRAARALYWLTNAQRKHKEKPTYGRKRLVELNMQQMAVHLEVIFGAEALK